MSYKHKKLAYIAEPCTDSTDTTHIIKKDGGYVGEAYEEFFQNSGDWEKVENPWKITAFKSKNGNICTLRSNGLFRWNTDFLEGGLFEEKIIVDEEHSIYTVSNGKEEFSVGDKIRIIATNGKYNLFGTIASFSTCEGVIRLLTKEDIGNYTLDAENKIEKFSKVVCTTEDGKDLYAGDTVYSVDPANWNYNYYILSVNNIFIASYKRFSSEKLAKEYIAENKKKYNAKDIKRALSAVMPISADIIFNSLIKELKNGEN